MLMIQNSSLNKVSSYKFFKKLRYQYATDNNTPFAAHVSGVHHHHHHHHHQQQQQQQKQSRLVLQHIQHMKFN